MGWLKILSLVIYIILSFQEAVTVGICSKSRDAALPIRKSIGTTVHLMCPHFGCGGSSYNFTHHNPTTGEADVIHQGSHFYRWKITSLSNAGDYCCSKQCNGDQRQCCIRVEVPPVIQWKLPEAIIKNTSVSGSCRATGYPRPFVGVINNCNYQYQYKVIDEYTSEVVFTIKSVTKKCQYIYCYTPSTVDTKKVLLAENVCGGYQTNSDLVTSTAKASLATRSVEPATTVGTNIQEHSSGNINSPTMYTIVMMSLIILLVL